MGWKYKAGLFLMAVVVSIWVISAEVTQPAIAIAIRDQLYEIAIQSVASAKESRMHKKCKGMDYLTTSKTGANAVDLVKLFGNKSSVVRSILPALSMQCTCRSKEISCC